MSDLSDRTTVVAGAGPGAPRSRTFVRIPPIAVAVGNQRRRSGSCYSRGVDMMNATYQYLDLVPKGRDGAEGSRSK